MQAMILSGGKGTRLRPLTIDSPKPLLPIVNTPFLSYPLALLRKHKVSEVVLCTADSIDPYKSFLASQKKLGTVVTCSREFKELGTGGAIKNAEKLTDSTTFIFNGDVLTNINLSAMLKFHIQKKSSITISLIPVMDPSSYGLLDLDSSGKILRFVEKPNCSNQDPNKTYLINAGIYLFEREVFDLIPSGVNCSVERELFPNCLKKGISLYGFIAKDSYWLDIGRPEQYLKANLDVLTKKFFKIFKLDRFSSIGKKSVIHKTATISKENVIIGNHCRIGSESILKNCILLDHVMIGNNVQLENCIVGGWAKVGDHSVVKRSQVIGGHSIITPFSQL